MADDTDVGVVCNRVSSGSGGRPLARPRHRRRPKQRSLLKMQLKTKQMYSAVWLCLRMRRSLRGVLRGCCVAGDGEKPFDSAGKTRPSSKLTHQSAAWCSKDRARAPPSTVARLLGHQPLEVSAHALKQLPIAFRLCRVERQPKSLPRPAATTAAPAAAVAIVCRC